MAQVVAKFVKDKVTPKGKVRFNSQEGDVTGTIYIPEAKAGDREVVELPIELVDAPAAA